MKCLCFLVGFILVSTSLLAQEEATKNPTESFWYGGLSYQGKLSYFQRPNQILATPNYATNMDVGIDLIRQMKDIHGIRLGLMYGGMRHTQYNRNIYESFLSLPISYQTVGNNAQREYAFRSFQTVMGLGLKFNLLAAQGFADTTNYYIMQKGSLGGYMRTDLTLELGLQWLPKSAEVSAGHRIALRATAGVPALTLDLKSSNAVYDRTTSISLVYTYIIGSGRH